MAVSVFDKIKTGLEEAIVYEQGRQEQLETSICAVASMLSPQQIATGFEMTPEDVLDVLAKHDVSPSGGQENGK